MPRVSESRGAFRSTRITSRTGTQPSSFFPRSRCWQSLRKPTQPSCRALRRRRRFGRGDARPVAELWGVRYWMLRWSSTGSAVMAKESRVPQQLYRTKDSVDPRGWCEAFIHLSWGSLSRLAFSGYYNIRTSRYSTYSRSRRYLKHLHIDSYAIYIYNTTVYFIKLFFNTQSARKGH